MDNQKTVSSCPAPIGNIGGPFSYEVDRLLGLAFDVEEVRDNAPPDCSERLSGAVAVLREVAEELTPASIKPEWLNKAGEAHETQV